MKLSLRLATSFFSWCFPPLAELGQIAALLLFFGLLFLPLTAEAGLPRAAVSIPTDQNLATGLKAAEQCAVPGKLIVLPPLSFSLLGDQNPASSLEAQAQAVQGLPEGSEVWLHVIVGVGSATGNQSEKQITERADAFVKSMALSAPAVRGLIVEIETKENHLLAAPDLLEFGLARLALVLRPAKLTCVWRLFSPWVCRHARRYCEEDCHLFRSAGNDLYGGMAPGCRVDFRKCVE